MTEASRSPAGARVKAWLMYAAAFAVMLLGALALLASIMTGRFIWGAAMFAAMAFVGGGWLLLIAASKDAAEKKAIGMRTE